MANRYWVGGAGTWDAVNTANWSATSGGAGGASVPTSVDDVFFNASSGISGNLIQIATGLTVFCNNLNFTGCVATFSAAANCTLEIYASLILAATVQTNGFTGTFSFVGAGTNILAPNGRALNCGLSFNNPLGRWTLQGNVHLGNAGGTALISGTLALNNFILTGGRFRSIVAANRTIEFGTSGQIVVVGSATVFTILNPAGFSYTGNSNIQVTPQLVQPISIIIPNLSEAQAMNFKVTAPAGVSLFDVQGYYNNLDLSAFLGTINNNSHYIYGNLTLGPGVQWAGTTSNINFIGTNRTQTVISNGATIPMGIYVDAPGSTVVFQDPLNQTFGSAFAISRGTVSLPGGQTSTVGSFTTVGPGPRSLISTIPGVQAFISLSSGTVNVHNLSITDSHATGGATWYSLYTNGNVNGGNNTTWIFGIPPGGGYVTGDGQCRYVLRSFATIGTISK